MYIIFHYWKENRLISRLVTLAITNLNIHKHQANNVNERKELDFKKIMLIQLPIDPSASMSGRQKGVVKTGELKSADKLLLIFSQLLPDLTTFQQKFIFL